MHMLNKLNMLKITLIQMLMLLSVYFGLCLDVYEEDPNEFDELPLDEEDHFQ